MTVAELIEKLKEMPQNANVVAFDDEACDYVSITHIGVSSTGAVYIETQSDDI